MEEVVEEGLLLESRWFIAGGCSFLVSALGRVPNCGSVGLSTGLLISEGTDSVLLILVTEKQVGDEMKKKKPFNQTYFSCDTISYIDVLGICS